MVVGLLDKPILGPCRVKMRPYQGEFVAAVEAEFGRGVRSTLGILPTGAGKTICFGMIVRRELERGGRALVLAHRGELIEQAANKLDMLGVEAGIEKASQYARAYYDPDCVIATVQTLQRDRLLSFGRDHFSLIVTDEGHHATAASYGRIYDYFQGAKHLGVTATADRADEDNLGSVFETVAYEMTLWEAMTAPDPGPYLSRLRFVQCGVDIDLRDIRTTGGDFNQGDLEARITPLIDVLANAIRQEMGDRTTLVFTPDVGSAQAMASAMQSLGIHADWVAGDDPDRRLKFDRFSSGELQVLVNCQLATEGYDNPRISAVALCRPTKSRGLYSQMVGRGTRLYPGKQDCLLIDFSYLTAKHDLVTAVELFDTTHTDSEVLEIAEELSRKKKGLDLVDCIEEAERIKRERQVLRVKARERNVTYRRVSYDPLSVCDALGIPWRGSKDAVINRASPGQVNVLNRFGIEDAANLSKTKASTIIDFCMHRSKNGLATPKQVSWLIAKGVDATEARHMTKGEASARLDELFKQKRA